MPCFILHSKKYYAPGNGGLEFEMGDKLSLIQLHFCHILLLKSKLSFLLKRKFDNFHGGLDSDGD